MSWWNHVLATALGAPALDHTRGVQIIELITRLTRKTGAATIVVTHDEATLDTVDARVHLADGLLLGELEEPVRPIVSHL